MTNNENINIEKKKNNKSNFEYKEPIEIDDELNCMICYLPLFEPCVEPNCRSMFCKSCLTESLNNNKQSACPFCQQVVDIGQVSLPPKFVTNTLDDLLVYCSNCNSGNDSDDDKSNIEYMQRRYFKNHICKPLEASPSFECSAKHLLCPWNSGNDTNKTNQSLTDHESSCHFLALSPILTQLTNKINQLQNDNQNNLSFLLNKINFLESIIPKQTTITTTSTTSPPQTQTPEIDQLTNRLSLFKKPSPTTINTTNTSTYTNTNTYTQKLNNDEKPSIQYFNDTSYNYVIGKVPSGTKVVSLDGGYQDSWPLTKGNISSNVETLILLDGFAKLVYEIPKSIKTIHFGDIVKLHGVYLSNGSLNEIHFHDGCKITFVHGLIPDTAKTVHFYNVTQPLLSDSIPKNVKCCYFHDGFSKSLTYGILPSTLNEMHFYNIKTTNISIPSSIKTLHLHDGFEYQSHLELPNQLESLHLYNIVYAIKSFPSNLKAIYIQNYSHDKSLFPKKAKVIEKE